MPRDTRQRKVVTGFRRGIDIDDDGDLFRPSMKHQRMYVHGRTRNPVKSQILGIKRMGSPDMDVFARPSIVQRGGDTPELSQDSTDYGDALVETKHPEMNGNRMHESSMLPDPEPPKLMSNKRSSKSPQKKLPNKPSASHSPTSPKTNISQNTNSVHSIPSNSQSILQSAEKSMQVSPPLSYSPSKKFDWSNPVVPIVRSTRTTPEKPNHVYPSLGDNSSLMDTQDSQNSDNAYPPLASRSSTPQSRSKRQSATSSTKSSLLSRNPPGHERRESNEMQDNGKVSSKTNRISVSPPKKPRPPSPITSDLFKYNQPSLTSDSTLTAKSPIRNRTEVSSPKRPKSPALIAIDNIFSQSSSSNDLSSEVRNNRAPTDLPPALIPVSGNPALTYNTSAARAHVTPTIQSKASFQNQDGVNFCMEPFVAAAEAKSTRPRVLLAVTGSVATIKLNDLVTGILQLADVIVITTNSASHFIRTHAKPIGDVRYYNDESEYVMWSNRGDPVLHIELRKWADLFVIAPLSANTLAKLASGICDNLVTCVARAWDFEKPFYVAPAMNSLMWTHPFTSKHIQDIEDIGIRVIPPISKMLMCGDSGVGAMASVNSILEEVHTGITYYPRNFSTRDIPDSQS